jgi:hypothetical protein
MRGSDRATVSETSLASHTDIVLIHGKNFHGFSRFSIMTSLVQASMSISSTRFSR